MTTSTDVRRGAQALAAAVTLDARTLRGLERRAWAAVDDAQHLQTNDAEDRAQTAWLLWRAAALAVEGGA